MPVNIDSLWIKAELEQSVYRRAPSSLKSKVTVTNHAPS
jgi:hypothetical protein